MRASASLFAQLLRQIPPGAFRRIVREEGGDRHAKGFTCQTQLVAMLYLHLAQARSLSEVCDGLRQACGRLNHIGLTTAPPKSTLAYANAHRPARIYARCVEATLASLAPLRPGKRRRFRFRHPLLSLDATTIALCAAAFPWARYRHGKGAAKLHLVLDHDGYLPSYAVITPARVADVTVARTLAFPPGSLVVMDRGYTDYALYQQWTDAGIFFVTRLRDNAVIETVAPRPCPRRGTVVRDEVIRLASPHARARCAAPLRRIVVWDSTTQTATTFLTNHLTLGATTVAAVYRDRWAIEIFFRTLKQQLRIKTFVGTSANALALQIWTALLAVLLLAICRFRSTFGWTLPRLLALLRTNLFTYRDLWAWLNQPFGIAPEGPPAQLPLPLALSPARS